MSIETKLEIYTSAVDALKNHQEQNQSVFAQNERLVMSMIDAENELRDEVALRGTEGMKKNESNLLAQNGQFRILVTPQTQKVYDEEKIKAKMPEAIKEQDRPARVTISRIPPPKAE